MNFTNVEERESHKIILIIIIQNLRAYNAAEKVSHV